MKITRRELNEVLVEAMLDVGAQATSEKDARDALDRLYQLSHDPASLAKMLRDDEPAEETFEEEPEGDSDVPLTVALPSDPDGQKAEELLTNTRNQGIVRIYELAKPAVARLLANPAKSLRSAHLFNNGELADLSDLFSEVLGTANLLGHSRVHLRQRQVNQHAEKFSEDEPTDFSVFAEEEIEPMPPEEALDYFQGLIPKIGKDPERWGSLLERHAFTIANLTDETLLAKIQNILRRTLATGKRIKQTPGEIDEVLMQAGVHQKSPAYSDMCLRTNMMDAYNTGWSREVADPEMRETFPWWMYYNPNDNRSRPWHAEKHGKYYLATTPFMEVRGVEKKDIFSCRCTGIPQSKWRVAELKKQGIRAAA